jgi:hypothetical protein
MIYELSNTSISFSLTPADEAAAALVSVDYRDDAMKVKRIYTAWDNRRDEDILFTENCLAPSSIQSKKAFISTRPVFFVQAHASREST